MKYRLFVAQDEYTLGDTQIDTLKSLGFIFRESQTHAAIDIDKTLKQIGIDDSSAHQAHVYYDVNELEDILELEAKFQSIDGFEGIIINEDYLEIYNDYRE